MNIADIQKRLLTLESTMIDRGWRQCRVEFNLESDKLWFHISAKHPISDDYSDRMSEYVRGDTVDAAFSSAYTICLRLINTQEAARDAFRKSLARTIETGQTVGIDTDFLNPLIAQMKALSENIITDQSPPDTMSEDAERPWDTEISGTSH